MSRRKRNKRRAQALDMKQQPPVMSQSRVADSFQNVLTRAGYGMPNPLETTAYPMTRMSFDYQQLNALYRSHWIVQRIINVVPNDMMKNGYDILSDIEPDLHDKIQAVIRRTRLHQKIISGLRWGRLYGGAAGIILIEGDEDRLEEELDLDLIAPGAFKGLLIVDRWNGIAPTSELITDINNPDFGMPASYDIMLENGESLRIHASRICRFIGREMPYMEKLAENYWGTSEIEHVIDDLKKRDNVSWNIALLTFMANIRVLKMDGMENILSFASEKAQTELYNTVQGMNMLLNNNALQLLGKDDDYQQHQYAFSGLGDIYDRFMMDISGACGIPVTKLFGRSPAGLNSTGESDMQNYYDLIESNQEAQLRPVLEKILPIICVSALGKIPDDLDFVFNPVRRSNDNEKQDLGSQQTAAVTAAFTAGLISQKTALKELQQSSKRTGMWTNITDDDIATADDAVIGVGEDVQVPSFTMNDAAFKEDEHPRDENGRFSSNSSSTNEAENGKIKPTAQGANKLLRKNFRSKAVFNNKWSKHSKEFPGEFKSKEEYLKAGVDLLESQTSKSILGHLNREGQIIRYDVVRNIFVKGSIERGIYTMFKPKNGKAYYKFMKRKDLENGGKV